MPQQAMLAAFAVSVVLCGVHGNAALSKEVHSKEWHLLKAQLENEEKTLAAVEESHAKTMAELEEQSAERAKTEQKLSLMRSLSEKLREAEATKEQAVQDVEGLSRDGLFIKGDEAPKSAKPSQSLLSVRQSLDADLEAAAKKRAKAQAAELSTVAAKAVQLKSQVQHLKENLLDADQKGEKSKQTARSVAKAEEEEVASATSNQEKLAALQTGTRVALARNELGESQKKVLEKQEELKAMKEAVGVAKQLLQGKEKEVREQTEKYEDAVKDSTKEYNEYNEAQSALKSKQQEADKLNANLTKLAKASDDIEKAIVHMREEQQKEREEKEKRRVALHTDLTQKDEELAKLVADVNATKGEIDETMAKLKLEASKAKEEADANSKRLEEERIHMHEQAEANTRKVEDEKNQIPLMRKSVDRDIILAKDEIRFKTRIKIKSLRRESDAHPFPEEAEIEATKMKRREAEKKLHALENHTLHLMQQIQQVKTHGEGQVRETAEEMNRLHDETMHVRAMESASIFKVNKRMKHMMSDANMLKSNFRKIESEEDRLRAEEGRSNKIIETENDLLKGELEKYNQIKSRIEDLYKVLKVGQAKVASQMELVQDDNVTKADLEAVRNFQRELKRTHAHKEHLVAPLMLKVQQLKAGKKKVPDAASSLDDLANELDSLEEQRPKLGSAQDSSVNQVLQEVENMVSAGHKISKEDQPQQKPKTFLERLFGK
eukprot:TRINITY_DN34216_c0_g1_i1.p1 TRINITY_DN34216_c0_g1~~TRINITY_DN34216_c0_g1_i1.p1  ORF type:complete len:720 (-),score=252.12 TRINITY_DN34216_c0_g1_i1:79-2238(-)